jgi:hypothetical protein
MGIKKQVWVAHLFLCVFDGRKFAIDFERACFLIEPYKTHTTIPDVVLFLGLDAAGKDHVANILTDMIEETGKAVEKRRSFLCGRRSFTKDSSKKTLVAMVRQKLFLSFHGPFAPFVPPVLNWLLKRDISKYAPPQSKLVVVGHHAIKALAFSLAKTCHGSQDFAISPSIENTLRQLREKTKAHVVMVEVDPRIRAQRIKRRIEAGCYNDIDLFISRQPMQAKRIEEKLSYVAREILGGVRLVNNNLPDAQLKTALIEGFVTTQPSRHAGAVQARSACCNLGAGARNS